MTQGLTFSSMKFKHPSLGTKAAIFFPFLINCTRAHFLIAEFGCLASMPLHQSYKSSSIITETHNHNHNTSRVNIFLHLFQHNALSMGRSSKWFLPFISKMRLLVRFVGPPLPSAVGLQFAGSSHSTCLPA